MSPRDSSSEGEHNVIWNREGVHFQILSDEDLDRIHWGTLHILEKIGVQVDSPTCRKLLKDNGCDVDEKTRIAKIPSHLVEEALTKKKAAHYPRRQGPEVRREARHEPQLHDRQRQRRGRSGLRDRRREGRPRRRTVANSSRIIDALPNVHIHWPMVSSTDMPAGAVHLHDLDASLNNTAEARHVRDRRDDLRRQEPHRDGVHGGRRREGVQAEADHILPPVHIRAAAARRRRHGREPRARQERRPARVLRHATARRDRPERRWSGRSSSATPRC